MSPAGLALRKRMDAKDKPFCAGATDNVPSGACTDPRKAGWTNCQGRSESASPTSAGRYLDEAKASHRTRAPSVDFADIKHENDKRALWKSLGL
jgi:hypothetical protein